MGLCQRLRDMAGSDQGYCFKDDDGEKSSVNALRSIARRVIRRAGLTGSKVGAHTIRHSIGTLVARKTGSALAVKAILQHDTQDTSMGYIHEVDSEIQQSLSPLEVLGAQRISGKNQQGLLGYPEVETVDDSVVVGGDDGVVEIDIVADTFEGVPPDVKIRPQLSSDDLMLLRRVMVSYARANSGDSDASDCRELLKRMLRRVK